MVEELLACFTALRDDPAYPTVRAVVLCARGKTFCAGGDLRDMTRPAEEQQAALAQLDALLRAINQAPQVVIARDPGGRAGRRAGAGLRRGYRHCGLQRQFRAARGATGARARDDLAVCAGASRLHAHPRTDADRPAFRLCAAHTWGLVQHYCADFELDGCVRMVLRDVLRAAPEALRACKELLFTVAAGGDTLDYRVALLERLRTSEEARQGAQAFLAEKTSAMGGRAYRGFRRCGGRMTQTRADKPARLAEPAGEPAAATRLIRKVLVANRGEIACRVMRTCRAMGIATVAVFSDADANARHVREADEAVHIGASAASASYLAIPALIAAAQRTGADAIHPGYGFLAENADFAAACAASGSHLHRPIAGGDSRAWAARREAKRLASAAGVPVVPGYDGRRSTPTRG